MKRIISFVLFAAIAFGALFLPLKAQASATEVKAGVIATASGPLNVRSSPSTGASVVMSLRKGSFVTLISQSGSWWKVEYAKNRYGYCYADYITATSSQTAVVATQSSALNIRSGRGTNYPVVGSLAKGERVIVLSASGSWSRILYHGTKTGYVSSQYLNKGNAGNISGVSLKVPDFKQTDSRWANVMIGTSGKTMAQIGCATTAIAMMESYRTGVTVYPDAMSKKLNYTSSGSVYWPTNYTVVTSSAGYLSGIYNRLRQGKPVLFGAKNAYGKQHWVVITGYSGLENLTASGFSIHDPGSGSRTNLQQFLNAYPTFYKYFHY